MAAESEEAPSSGNPALLAVVGAVVAFALLVGLLVIVDPEDPIPFRDRQGEAEEVAAAWLHAWVGADRPGLADLLAEPAPALAPTLDGFQEGLRPGPLAATEGPVTIVGDRATVPFEASVDLPGLGTWTYDGAFELADVDVPFGDDGRTERRWRVAFAPSAIHPRLTAERRLRVSRTWPVRAGLQLADGAPFPTGGPLRSIAGSTGPATAEQVAALGPPYQEGDTVGLSGLQASNERQLAGRPGGEVVLVQGDRVVDVEATFAGEPSTPVRSTLDARLLAAAEAALGTVGQPAALVAIQPSTGAIQAFANRPASGFNRALAGRYPPGSTFKVVTALALLTNGVTPDTRVSCPKEITVNGRRIRNAEEEELGDIDFRTAFVHSCNTAFIQLAEQLPPQALVDAARRLGFDGDPGLGVGAGTSQFPEPTGVVDQVSAAIGQGRVLATPFQMAAVAAAVAGDGYRKPHLVAPPSPVAADVLPAGIAASLQELMRRVVAEGTATRAQLPGAPVAGKTGTAEFGTAVPLRTHAWFIGFRGDLAVAVIVEDGGFGGEVAAPLAADFLRRAG